MARNRVRFISFLPSVIALQHKIASSALEASAKVVVNQARQNVRGGFRSGNFVTGRLAQNIQHGEIIGVLNPKIRVGSTIWTDEEGRFAPYPAYWEVGHYNVYTRSFEQEQWLTNAMKSTIKKQKKAAVRAARRTARQHGQFDSGFSLTRSGAKSEALSTIPQ